MCVVAVQGGIHGFSGSELMNRCPDGTKLIKHIPDSQFGRTLITVHDYFVQ